MKLDDVVREHTLKILAQNQGNKCQTARDLGISLKTLHNWIDRWGLRKELMRQKGCNSSDIPKKPINKIWHPPTFQPRLPRGSGGR